MRAPVFSLLILCSVVFADSNIDVKREGNVFNVHTYIDIERSAEYVWPFVWELRHLKEYLDNVQRIDSVGGGDGWYDVKFTADFPFVHLEVTNHKWIIQQGVSIGSRLVGSKIESPLPIAVSESESYWRIEPLGDSCCRLHFETLVKVHAAGFEALYIGIARRDSKRIMKNFKRYVESHDP